MYIRQQRTKSQKALFSIVSAVRTSNLTKPSSMWVVLYRKTSGSEIFQSGKPIDFVYRILP
jgi:hypothetical protein